VAALAAAQAKEPVRENAAGEEGIEITMGWYDYRVPRTRGDEPFMVSPAEFRPGCSVAQVRPVARVKRRLYCKLVLRNQYLGQ
jgi:hypothetical protein